MILRREELELAREYARSTAAESLTREQMKLVLDRGRVIYRGPSPDLRRDLGLRTKVLWL